MCLAAAAMERSRIGMLIHIIATNFFLRHVKVEKQTTTAS